MLNYQDNGGLQGEKWVIDDASIDLASNVAINYSTVICVSFTVIMIREWELLVSIVLYYHIVDLLFKLVVGYHDFWVF